MASKQGPTALPSNDVELRRMDGTATSDVGSQGNATQATLTPVPEGGPEVPQRPNAQISSLAASATPADVQKRTRWAMWKRLGKTPPAVGWSPGSTPASSTSSISCVKQEKFGSHTLFDTVVPSAVRDRAASSLNRHERELEEARGPPDDAWSERRKRWYTRLPPWARVYVRHGAFMRAELLAGITVALAMIPEAVSFSFVAGVPPTSGLWAAVIVGVLTSYFGGRPGMVSGATGAMAVVAAEFLHDRSEQYLYFVLLIVGVIQVLVGVFQLGRFMRIMPASVMVGFVSGLAIVIGRAQLTFFQDDEGCYLTGSQLWYSLMITTIVALIVHFLPKKTKTVPAAFVGLMVAIILEYAFNLGTPVVGDLASVDGFPGISVPDVDYGDWDTWRDGFMDALLLSAVALIETIMTLYLIDDVTDTHGDVHREATALGVANFLCGFASSMGGCALIGQSLINVSSGGIRRMSSMVAGTTLLIFVAALGFVVEFIPTSGLVGVMTVVVLHTFDWRFFRIARRVPVIDVIVAILVTVVTVIEDLVIGVLVGLIVMLFHYAWSQHTKLTLGAYDFKEPDGTRVRVYCLSGTLFFGSIRTFHDLFDIHFEDPEMVVLSLARARVTDFSALEALNELGLRYEKEKKVLYLADMDSHTALLVIRSRKYLKHVHTLDTLHKNYARLSFLAHVAHASWFAYLQAERLEDLKSIRSEDEEDDTLVRSQSTYPLSPVGHGVTSPAVPYASGKMEYETTATHCNVSSSVPSGDVTQESDSVGNSNDSCSLSGAPVAGTPSAILRASADGAAGSGHDGNNISHDAVTGQVQVDVRTLPARGIQVAAGTISVDEDVLLEIMATRRGHEAMSGVFEMEDEEKGVQRRDSHRGEV